MTAGPEKCNTAEAQDKDFKKAVMNALERLKEDRDIPLNEVCENTNSGTEWQKPFKTERKNRNMEETQTETKLEKKSLGSQTKTSEVSLNNTEINRESKALETK